MADNNAVLQKNDSIENDNIFILSDDEDDSNKVIDKHKDNIEISSVISHNPNDNSNNVDTNSHNHRDLSVKIEDKNDVNDVDINVHNDSQNIDNYGIGRDKIDKHNNINDSNNGNDIETDFDSILNQYNNDNGYKKENGDDKNDIDANEDSDELIVIGINDCLCQCI
jgi:hypothetical protein